MKLVLILTALFFLQHATLAQTHSVTGHVTNKENGNPIPGVTVLLKGSSSGTSTNVGGNFSISSTKSGTLIFSAVGFDTKEIPVENRSVINVTMDPNVGTLENVVVVGYGTQQRVDLTGSISSVDAKELQDIPVPSFSEALSGKMAGVQVQQTSAAPGGGISIIIRGIGSISAGNSPLYVIDGVPIDNSIGDAGAQGKGESSQQPVNPLSTLNIGDIQSIDVLKDASATAIYGSRGANGVVIITTKQGIEGKPRLQLVTSAGVQELTHKMPMMDLKGYIQEQVDILNMGWIEAGGKASDPNSVRRDNAMIPNEYKDLSLVKYYDWQDIIYRNAPIQNYQISASGGGESVRYYISGNYVDQSGLIVNSNYKRYGLRANIDAKISDKIHVGFRISPSYSSSNINETEGIPYYGGVVTTLLRVPPIYPAYNEDGTFSQSFDLHYDNGTTRQSTYGNPLATSLGVSRQFDQFRTMGSLFAVVDIIDNLKFKTSISSDINVFNSNEFWPSTVIYHGRLPPVNPTATSFNSRNISWINENTLNYKNTFNGKHNLEVLAGFSSQKSNFFSSNIVAFGFPNDRVQTINAAGGIKSGSSLRSAWSLLSLYGRINYNYDQKYLLTATLRRDGSSRFGKDTKWGVFPSASIGWRISKEEFMKNVSFVNELKVRASYGLIGNNQIPNYASYGLVMPFNYILGSGDGNVVNGLAQNTISNPNLGWERAKEFDIGLNVTLFNNRVHFAADYYNKTTSDLLLDVPVPYSTGFSTAIRNLGEMRNQGFEFALETRNIQNKNFTWATSINISSNKNKVLKLGPGGSPIYTANTSVDNSISHATQIGKPLGSFYGYVFDGIFNNQHDIDSYPHLNNTKPGDLKFKDLNGDGAITIDDKTLIGNNYPDYTYGITNTFVYRNFDLNILIQGVQGAQVINLMKRNNGYMRNVKYFSNYWKSPEEPGDGKTPSPAATGNSRQMSSWMVEDASYTRIKSVTLGYKIPQKVFAQIRIYFNIQNLYTFTDYQGYNPEVNTMSGDLPTASLTPGIDYGTYPVPRIFTFGLNLTF